MDQDATEEPGKYVLKDADDNNQYLVSDDLEEEIGTPQGELLPQAKLLESIGEAQKALDMFLGNQFETARAMMEPQAESSMYHSLSCSTICYMQASMTLEQADIHRAVDATKRALRVCQRHRRPRHGLVAAASLLLKPGDFTDEQCHAELCYAELLLEKAVLTFAQDESLMGFVRGGLKIRDCYRAYRLCWRLLRKRAWGCPELRMHFESGARLGDGAFNLLLSLLPTALLRLLQFVGFSGNRRRGLRQLRTAASMDGSLRAPLVRVLLLAYHTSFTHVLGSVDLQAVDRLLQPCLQRYPDGALFLYFEGRHHLLSGRARQAAESFERSLSVQAEWPQLRQLCRWELMWAMAYAGRWREAACCALELSGQTRWSRATVLYQRAAFIYQSGAVDDPEVARLMKEVSDTLCCGGGVPNLPVERLAALRAARFVRKLSAASTACDAENATESQNPTVDGAENNAENQTRHARVRLILPGLELVYAWNGLPAVGRDPESLAGHLADVQAASDEIDRLVDAAGADAADSTTADDLALVLLLKGACMAELKRETQAEQCLLQVTEGRLGKVRDRHVTAWAWLELARLRASQGDKRSARRCLDSCRSAARGVCLESRVQFRAHAVGLEIQEAEESAFNGDDDDDSSMSISTPSLSDADDGAK